MNNIKFRLKSFFTKTDVLSWIGVMLIVICAILFINFRNKKRVESIMNKRLYTIGRISGFNKTKTTRFVEYIYSYNGKNFQSEKSYSNNNYIIGERFLVVFNPNDNTSFLLPFKIDLNIEEPINGWKIPPNNIDENDIINYLKNKY